MLSLHPHTLPCRLIVGACASLFLFACGGGDGGGPIGPQTRPVATVSVSLATGQVTVGNTTTASVVLRDSEGATLTGRSVAWSSSATAVATVNESGVVTGVAAGSAQIVATSEGKSGNAVLTVVVDPATTASVSIGAITRNGVAVDLSKVAGIISIDVAETVPPGFNGTITVTVDTVLVSRTTYPAPAVAGVSSTENASRGQRLSETVSSRVLRRNVDFNTALPITTISGDEITARGKLDNGVHEVLVQMSGTVGGTAINKQDTETFTTANPPGSILVAGRWKNLRTLMLDGRLYRTGETFTVSAAELNYGVIPVSAIEQIEIVHGGASSVYGSDAIAGVVNLITGQKREFSTSEFPCESGASGTMFQVTGVTRGGIERDPRINPFVLNGSTIDANRDGMPDREAAPMGYNLGTGITGQVIIGDVSLPDSWFALNQPTWCDNVAPRLGLGAFSAFGRVTTPWSAIDLTGGRALPLSNVIPTDFDLNRWADLTAITEAGVGLRTATPLEFFAGTGTTLSTVVLPGNKWNGSLPASMGYNHRLGMTVFDRFDNAASTLLKTTAQNPIGINGTSTSPGQNASVRIQGTTPSAFTSIGLKDRAWSISSSYNPNVAYDVTDVFGATEQPLIGSLQRNGSFVIGSANSKVVIPTNRSGNQVFVNFTQLLAQSGGVREGRWEGNFSGFNSAGLPFTPADSRIRFLYDFTNPAVPTSPGNAITAPIVAGTPIPFQLTATDNIHVSQVGGSLRFQGFENSSWERGYVEVPFLFSDYWSPWTNPQTSWTGTYSGAIPTRFALANPGTGLVTSPYYDLTGYSLFSYDAVDKRSGFLDFPIASGLLPAPKTFNNTRVSISANGSNFCLGRYDVSTACPGGYPRKATVTGVVLSPTADPQGIGQMHVYGIHNTTKQIVRFCLAQEVSATTIVGPDTRQEFECEADLSHYKGPAGFFTVFAWFISTLFWIAAKTQFLFWLMVQGASE